MGLLEWLTARRRERIVKAYAALGLKDSQKKMPGRSRLVHWRHGDYTLHNSELLFAAVSRIANALSAMPVQLYRGSEPVYDDLNDLVAADPNGNMTSTQFFRAMEACRGTSGDAYALKVVDQNLQTKKLEVLDPARVTPFLLEDTGELWYRIRAETGGDYYLNNWYVLHIPFLSTNGYRSVNPVSVLFDTLRYAEDIQRFSREQLEKGVNAAVVLEAPANLGEEQRVTMTEAMLETYKNTQGNVLLLESGVTAKALNLSPVDTRLFEVEKITRSKVAMVYNIPPHLLGDYSDVSFASQEQQMLEFLMLTMLPIVTAYEQELDRKLLTRARRRRGYHFRFDMDAILRADAATQADVDYKSVRSAWKTPDEIRAYHKLPALPDGIGKKVLISQDMAPLERVLSGEEAAP